MHSSRLFYLSITIALTGLASSAIYAKAPSEKFNLHHWKLQIPTDEDNNGKVDQIDVRQIKNYIHPDFFYLDNNEFLVFNSPNKAATTKNSTNTRSELRQMYRGVNTKIKTKGKKNNFALKANKRSKKYAAVGGQLEATLRVMHVALNAKRPDKKAAYSVVVGQIHAVKDKDLVKKGKGFGYGNEPIKIFYKKWPGHNTGSVFWTYERNLAKEDPNRDDIAYPVWGNTWDNPEDPGENGIKLGELFNYNINVHNNIMYLTFRTTDPSETKQYEVDLSNNIDAHGNVDELDNPKGYTGDSFYFKAGAYNQCSTKESEGIWYAGCKGTGDWETDKANGDYASVAFKSIQLAHSTKPK